MSSSVFLSKDDIQISFIGENANGVTGSCILISTPNRKILLECGLWQSSGDIFKSFLINNQKFPFKAKDIDYVFINHCHIDHSGRLPLLYKRGGHATTVVPDGNKKIMELLLIDGANIALNDAKILSLRFRKNYEAVFSIDDVGNALYHTKEYSLGQLHTLDEFVKFRFVSSGHILNSAQLELFIKEGTSTTRILYTSDLGNILIDNAYTDTFVPVEKADIVIGESTYGATETTATRKMRNEDIEKLKETVISVCEEKKGKILIPVFANQRSQQLLTILYELFHEDEAFNIPVIYDSPLGARVCRAFSELLKGKDAKRWKAVLGWRNLVFTEDVVTSRAFMKAKGPAIILASSGFLTNGRARSWTETLLPDSNNTILFCGYSDKSSLASIIKEGRLKKIKFKGRMIPNRCSVVDLHSFSSHMQRKSLVSYYGSIQCQKIFLVHGENESRLSLAESVREELSKNNISAKVFCAEKGQVYTVS